MLPSPQIVEMLGFAGFDWVLIDCEHGSIGLADVELMAMACDAVGITPIARPKTNSASDIQSVMDRGVMGVQVPHINTAEDARRAVSAVKFGPGAARGLAAGTRPDSWGLGARMPDFARAANAQSLVCVQLEHEEALAQHRRNPRGRGHRRVLHRPVGPVAVHGLSGQSQGAARRSGDRRCAGAAS